MRVLSVAFQASGIVVSEGVPVTTTPKWHIPLGADHKRVAVSEDLYEMIPSVLKGCPRDGEFVYHKVKGLLGKEQVLCPDCGADQDEAFRRRRVPSGKFLGTTELTDLVISHDPLLRKDDLKEAFPILVGKQEQPLLVPAKRDDRKHVIVFFDAARALIKAEKTGVSHFSKWSQRALGGFTRCAMVLRPQDVVTVKFCHGADKHFADTRFTVQRDLTLQHETIVLPVPTEIPAAVPATVTA
jgi:hypothetical protein